jgi:hypothetical protein
MKYWFVFIPGILLISAIAIAGYKKRRTENKEKSNYVNELMKKGDLDGAADMLRELTGIGGFGDALPIVSVKFHCLKNDFENAWKFSESIMNADSKLLFQGMILLIFGKKAEFEGHLFMMETGGFSAGIQNLKRLSFSSREELTHALLEL